VRRVKTDKLFCGEVLVDCQESIYATLSHLTEKRTSERENKFQYNQRIILRVTNWRFLITLLGKSRSKNEMHQDFSWGEIREIASSKGWVAITLENDTVFSFKTDYADFSSIKLWALSEAIKTEEKSGLNTGDAWEQSKPINLKCETKVPFEGLWTPLLKSYGLILKRGEKPKRMEWNDKLSISVVSRAFYKNYLIASREEEGAERHTEQKEKTTNPAQNIIHKDIKIKSNSSNEATHACNINKKIKTQGNGGEQTPKSHKDIIPKSDKVLSVNRQTNQALKSQDYAITVQEVANKLEGIVGQEDAKKKMLEIMHNIVIRLENPEKSWETEKNYSCNMIFAGNPGTGRSSISRIFAEALGKLGILSKGQTTRIDCLELIGTSESETALNTKNILDRARGGVLFIERASLLSQGRKEKKSDQIIIDTILETIGQNGEDIALIAAGNTEHMQELINSNSKVANIFTNKLSFADYTSGEMKKIFHEMAHADKFTVHGICNANLDEIFTSISSVACRAFGNAREVRKIYEQVLHMQKGRISSLRSLMPISTEHDEESTVILPCDLPSLRDIRIKEYAKGEERNHAKKDDIRIKTAPNQKEPNKIKELIIYEIKRNRAVLASQRRWKGEVDRNGKISNMEKWIREGIYPFLINCVSARITQETGCNFHEAEAPYFSMSNGGRYIVSLERLAEEIDRIVGDDA